MPTDPAMVPELTDADVEREFSATEDPDRLYVERLYAYPNGFGERMRTFAARIYALAASRVDTAEVERRAASKALVALKAEVYRGTSRDRMAMLDLITEHLQKLWPAPRECVPVKPSVVSWHEGGWCKYDLADETGKVVGHVDRENAYYPLGTLLGRYITGNFAKKAVESAFAAEVGQ